MSGLMSDDAVNNPQHYCINNLEVIDVIDTYARNNYYRGNVIKYVCRADYKGSKLQDLKKARWYLDREISELDGKL